MKMYDEFEQWLQTGAPEGRMGDESEYPIAGCREVIWRVLDEARDDEGDRVLCIGPGSELIATELYRDGKDVWIADLSAERLYSLFPSMPRAHFMHCDPFDILPDEAYDELFDTIICTYSLHTIGGASRKWALESLTGLLDEDGSLIIGDVCFWTRAEHEICRRRCSQTWDDEAFYIIYDDFRQMFSEEGIRFIRLTHCSGVIVISGTEEIYVDEDDYLEE